MFGLDLPANIIGGLLQKKPNVPDFNPIWAKTAQTNAINNNIEQTPKLKEWAADINTFNQQQMEQMLKNAIPGYEGMKSQASDVLNSWLKGEIPKDVQDQVQNSAAARALGGGYGGSGKMGNLLARDLGLTSLGITQQGLNSAEKWIQGIAAISNPGLFNFSSMFLTPTQLYQINSAERTGQFQRDWATNQVNAEYAPGTIVGRAIIKESDQTSAFINNIASSFAGAAGGMAMGGM